MTIKVFPNKSNTTNSNALQQLTDTAKETQPDNPNAFLETLLAITATPNPTAQATEAPVTHESNPTKPTDIKDENAISSELSALTALMQNIKPQLQPESKAPKTTTEISTIIKDNNKPEMKPEMKPEINLDVKQPPIIQEAINKLSTGTIKETPVIAPTIIQEQTQTPDIPKDAYQDSLMKLGALINAQTTTTPTVNQITHLSAPPIVHEAASPTPPTQYDLQVEFLPVTPGNTLKDIQLAHIKIYPPELGPVIAKLDFKKNGVQLNISANNEKVKEIIESHLSQLQQSFMQSHIQITDIKVQVTPEAPNLSNNTNYQQNKNTNQHFEQRSTANKDEADDKNAKKENMRIKLNSLIDTFV